jgi:hypothetical protein
MPLDTRILFEKSEEYRKGFIKTHGDVKPFTCPYDEKLVFLRWDNENHWFYLSKKSVKQEHEDQIHGGSYNE